MTPAEKTIRRESIFLRVLWMLLFFLVWQVAVPLLGILVVAQLLYRLFYGAPSAHFMGFGDSLSQYIAHIGRFAVFNTDAKPWPVADWPQAHPADGEPAHVPKNKQATEQSAAVASAKVVSAEPTADTATESEASEASEALEVSEVVEEVAVTEESADAKQSAASTGISETNPSTTDAQTVAAEQPVKKDEPKP